VVYIEAALFLDKNDFSNQELIKKVETTYKSKILDSYLPIQRGSGFFISKSGYILTNEHVVYITTVRKFLK
jgi:S1-C subfamily serine protease